MNMNKNNSFLKTSPFHHLMSSYFALTHEQPLSLVHCLASLLN